MRRRDCATRTRRVRPGAEAMERIVVWRLARAARSSVAPCQKSVHAREKCPGWVGVEGCAATPPLADGGVERGMGAHDLVWWSEAPPRWTIAGAARACRGEGRYRGVRSLCLAHASYTNLCRSIVVLVSEHNILEISERIGSREGDAAAKKRERKRGRAAPKTMQVGGRRVRNYL